MTNMHKAWKTRRARYGQKGHAGSYSRFSPKATLFSAANRAERQEKAVPEPKQTGLDDGVPLPKAALTLPSPMPAPYVPPATTLLRRDPNNHVLAACKPCGRVWSVVELPKPTAVAAKMLTRALCPRCVSNQVLMATGEQAEAWRKGEHP